MAFNKVPSLSYSLLPRKVQQNRQRKRQQKILPKILFIATIAHVSLPNCSFATPFALSQDIPWTRTVLEDIRLDHCVHYSGETLLKLGGMIGFAGVLANTEIDESLRRDWQRHIRSDFTDDFAGKVDQFSTFPQIRVVIPIYLGSMFLAYQTQDVPAFNWLGNWGYHSLRTLLLGAPQQAVFNTILGAKRPEEGSAKWHFHGDGRSVSGHAFYGAVPFINAAKLSKPLAFKWFFYGLSALPSLARINDDKHYTSQVFLGWGFAYLAASSVAKSQAKRPPHQLSFSAYPLKNGGIFTWHLHF